MLKPNKPERFDGRRDAFVVNAWLYQVKQYLALAQVGNPVWCHGVRWPPSSPTWGSPVRATPQGAGCKPSPIGVAIAIAIARLVFRLFICARNSR